MIANQTSMISIRVTNLEREKFKLLSGLENKSVTQVIKELVDKALDSKKLTATDIRKLSKESRAALLKQMSEVSIPIYNKYKNELFVEEIMDGIE
ncbi:MAG: hypothetical protein KIT33_08565 [Candidatus Kapabacteria bacterium]|nr:hypothetical protein [Ignavibacteriota bacterium]MCW5885008.1 hypothetical protein [Candidatus Kapabacteria bacterium]